MSFPPSRLSIFTTKIYIFWWLILKTFTLAAFHIISVRGRNMQMTKTYPTGRVNNAFSKSTCLLCSSPQLLQNQPIKISAKWFVSFQISTKPLEFPWISYKCDRAKGWGKSLYKNGRQRRRFIQSSAMAVIAGFSYLFISFVVYCAAAEKNQTGK